MKYPVILLLLLLTFGVSLQAQGFQDPFRDPDTNTMMGGLGITWIDGQPYTTITLAPDFAFGKFGMGLYLQFLMDNNNSFKLRKDEYKGGAGILRAIRYVRYGHKYDPFYVRAGMLEMATLGNGFLVWNYNNASNYDKRKIGLALDVDLGKWGFESLSNNLGNLELIGGSLYFRPFRLMNSQVPILRNFRLYGTYVHEDEYPSWKTMGETETLDAYGLGADLQFLNTPILKSAIYYDYGKFADFGHGQATGINVIFPEFIGLFGLAANFEKRFLGEQFIPNFFGPLYELDRQLSPLEYPENRINELRAAPKTEGYFGQLVGHIIHKVRLSGSYQRLNGIPRSGQVHLEALAPDLVPKFELRAYYDKTGIETFKDFRTLDTRSLATVEVGYRLNRFMVVSTIYRWYWVKEEDEAGNIKYKPVERIEPRLSFSFQF
ncbi:MAG: hypothetical protein WAN36_13700 [Calditrichia bacterium]